MQLIDDVKKVCGFKEDKDLAGLLRKDKSTVSKWRNSGEIPATVERNMKILLECFRDPATDISTELQKMKQVHNLGDYFYMLKKKGYGGGLVAVVEKEKADAPLIVQAIIGKVNALSESEQAEAFRILAERFPDGQRTEK